MNQPEPELTASEIKAIMDMQMQMIKYIEEQNSGTVTWIDPPQCKEDRPWEMFFAE